MQFAIVDIETTGGYARQHRITEVAVVVHDGREVLQEYQTLLNPQEDIPGFITGLTGITNQMVSTAPLFEDISEDLFLLLHDKVFVAHNAAFDFNFIKEEFARIGRVFHRPRLCTVRLSRQLVPGLPSYSLGRLCHHLGIDIMDRHRAYGDAEATARLFSLLHARDTEGLIPKWLKRNSGEAFLPPHISMDTYAALPTEPGVYYFHDAQGKVIYVGKALNIQSRFKGHFTGSLQGWEKQYLRYELHEVSYELTGSELMALLVEAREIKRLWPKFNHAMKHRAVTWGVYRYQDGAGFERLEVGKIRPGTAPAASFYSFAEARAFVQQQMRTHALCARLSGMQKTKGPCYDYDLGLCQGACCGKESPESYNARVEKVFEEDPAKPMFLLVEKGRVPEERGLVWVENGVVRGIGYLPPEVAIDRPEALLTYMEPYPSLEEADKIVALYLEKTPHAKIIPLTEGSDSGPL
jgi:DNA polymerase III subunit epsilon